MTLYLERIRYGEDADNGHWEEVPKVEASSIAEDREGQVWHLNRALGQLTDDTFVVGADGHGPDGALARALRGSTGSSSY